MIKKTILWMVIFPITLGLNAQITELSNGNVGIGTTNPNLKLHIKNPPGGAAIGIERGGELWRFDIQHTGNNLFLSNSSNSDGLLFTYTNGGKFGVGTASPKGKLHISTNKWSESLLTLEDTHYSPYQVYKFQIESDGLKIKQDNTINYQFKTGGNFIVNNGSIGIGTISPQGKLHIETNKWLESLLTLKDTHYSPHQVYKFQIESDGLKIKQDNTVNYQFKTGGNFIVNNGSIGIGTKNPDMKLTVKGKIHTEEILVDLNVPAPDYVFQKDYNLRTLAQVEEYITENSHLPEIPSAKEFEEHGVMLLEMNMNLLKKVEELTLYTIQQQKEINSQNSEIEILKKENKKLDALFIRLSEIEKKINSEH